MRQGNGSGTHQRQWCMVPGAAAGPRLALKLALVEAELYKVCQVRGQGAALALPSRRQHRRRALRLRLAQRVQLRARLRQVPVQRLHLHRPAPRPSAARRAPLPAHVPARGTHADAAAASAPPGARRRNPEAWAGAWAGVRGTRRVQLVRGEGRGVST